MCVCRSEQQLLPSLSGGVVFGLGRCVDCLCVDVRRGWGYFGRWVVFRVVGGEPVFALTECGGSRDAGVSACSLCPGGSFASSSGGHRSLTGARRGVGGPCFSFVDGTCTEGMCCGMAGSSVCTLCPAGSFSNSTGAKKAGCVFVQLCVLALVCDR